MEQPLIITSISRVIFVGDQEYTEPKTVFRAKMEFNELIFQLPKEPNDQPLYSVAFGNKTADMYPNSIRFLPVGDFRRYELNRYRNGAGVYDVFFSCESSPYEEMMIFPVKTAKTEELFRKLFAIWNAKSEGYYAESLSLLYGIFAEMEKTHYLSSDKSKKIAPAIREIENNLFSPTLQCDTLARLCSMSYSYFNRLFTQKFSLSPKQYITQRRMQYACDLLTARQYKVEQIASMTGYEDTAFFCRVFKKTLGVSPKVYQKNHISRK